MSTEICKQETTKVLLVEGTNDCHVVMALCKAHNLPKTFGLYECGNDVAVLKRLNALILSSKNPTAIGVMLDADNPSLEGRWLNIKQKLNSYRYLLPDFPAHEGTIVEGPTGKPKLGFWFMPDNEASGMLEDFCAKLAEPSAFASARECVESAKERGLTTFKAAHLSKAFIHTYLAWQDEPGRPFGQAITAQTLRPQTEIAIRFTGWLRNLFE